MLLHNIYAKTLRDHWKGVLGWGLGLAAIAALEVVIYPSIRERADEMNRLVANYPEAFKAMFGLEDFTSGAGFIQAELYSLVVPLVLIALAISFGAGATAGEEEHKTVDLLLATPVTRGRVVVQKLLALVTGSVVVGLALTATLWLGSMFQDMGIGLDRLLAATASAVLLSLCFGGVALAVGCATGRRALAAATAAGLAIAGFLINSLSSLAEGLKPWRPVTLFYQYASNDPLRNGLDVGNAAVLLAVAAAMALAALVAFRRRDLAT
ncbi:MAG TPA: ABC transporter permease subunit [Actinomycetota bacterium]|nr:ABC transporter permease subunit [Actinomycetota bacterium]